jgi:acyl-CoA synthetase (AMP-forming)/AMP-acid ligase II
MILRSPYPDVSIPDLPLTAFVLEHAAGRGDKPALVDGPSGRTLTYAGLADSVRRMAGGLARRGVSQGDVVALFAPTCPSGRWRSMGSRRSARS